MAEAPTPVEIFCSYAHEDETWLQKLETHLSLLQRQGLISLWHDRRIAPGTDWGKAIDTHLETASVILLVVSADFLASDYCYGVEMKRALERQEAGEARVVPILVRPVDWKGAPFAHLQALPTDAKPLATWRNQESALAAVAASLRRMIEELAASVPPAALPAIWNVPYLRNPHFTGRDELLDRLHQQLSPKAQDDPMATPRAALTQPQAIKGLGGIGKTQIATEYAYRSREQGHYTHTFWVNAASEEALITSFVTIADLLPSFSAKEETDQRKLVAEIKRWLEQCNQRWLLIFDNADDLALVHDYFPQRGNGSILLTTRANAVASIGASLEVETMSFIEGTHLLLRRAQRFEHASDEEINEAGNIVMALDHFPLALDQAGAYIEETNCHFSDYLNIYQNHRKALLARRGVQTTNYPDSVATTWSLSFRKVEEVNPAAAELLRLCAYLSPDRIPEELIKDGAVHWSPLLKPAVSDLFTFNQLIAELLKFSLLKRLAEDNMLSIHRLVQAVLVDSMEPDEQRRWAERIVHAVNTVFPRHPKEEITTWPQCLRYLEQAQACDTLIQLHLFVFPEAADLLNRTGVYLHEHALYTIAEPLYQRAVHIWEQYPEETHLQVTDPLNGLAHLYSDQGKYAEAEQLYQQALRICEQHSGSEHLQAAISLNGLAFLSQQQGKYAEAEILYQRSLRIRELQLGPEHSDVAASLNGLAHLYHTQGKHAEAEPLYLRALRICEQRLGPEHPDMARQLNTLAYLYHEQGKYVEAELLYQRALRICELHLGQEHPLAAYLLNNLANIYRDQGKYTEAEQLYQQALAIRERRLGLEHPNLAYPLSNLANLYRKQGKYVEAEPLYQRALRICEQHFGPAHPDVAYTLHNLALLYHDQGKYAEAEPLCLRSLAIREQQFGPEHPDVALRLTSLAYLYREQGNYDEAEPLYQRALRIWEQHFGPAHPHVAHPLNGLANLYREQGKSEQAEPLYQRALRIREQQLGPEHPETAEIIHDLARFWEVQGNSEEASIWYARALAVREQALGTHHPKSTETRTRLIALLHALGQHEQAVQLEVAQVES
jgi:tetratricopeptide (TPR) repeat protein